MQKSASLEITDQFGAKKTMRLEKPVFTIGRNPANDLVLLSSAVSRDHGAIVYEDGTYFLLDRGSKSGLYVNGQPVIRCELHHLDKIAVGGHENCQIQFSEASAPVVFTSSQSLNLSQLDSAPGASANEELQRLARYVEVNQAFKFSLTPDDVLCLIVDAAIEMAKAERGCLMLKNESGQLEFKIARDSKRNLLSGSDFQISQTVAAEAFNENHTVVINNYLKNDQGPSQSIYDLQLRSIVCVPLRHFQMNEKLGQTVTLQHSTIGVLYVDSSQTRGSFSKTALTLLESLAFEASKSLENVRLMHEEQEKKRFEREFSTAREVQMALLPTSFVQPVHFEVAAHSLPCRYVGGDFYDLLTLEDGRAVLILGDVSGKGISAALLASMAQGVINALFNSGCSLTEVLTNLNRVLVRKSDANRFITLFCALLDPDGTFTFANAGHNPAILVRINGDIELLSTGSMLLGAFDFAEYHTQQTKLGPGDVVVTFSDGVTEAVNASNELFGDMRLEKLVRNSVRLTAKEIKDSIEQEVLSFTHGVPQGDDITLMVVKSKATDH